MPAHRQDQGELRSLSHFAIHENPSIMRLDGMFYNRQTEAGTFHVRFLLRDAVKFFEYLFLLLARYPKPPIDNLKDHRVRLLEHVDLDIHFGGRIIDGIR